MSIEANPIPKAELLTRLRVGWDDFAAYLSQFSTEQMTRPTDAGGWTAKDHVIHLVMWENGLNALLQRISRHEYMGIPYEAWQSGDFDRINAIIQRQNSHLTWAEVMRTFQQVHERLVERIEARADDDLQRPYRYYAPDSPTDSPVSFWIADASYRHYREHQPWIDAIARSYA
jgi:hypothetical protein